MKNFSRTDKYPCESGCCKDPDAIDCEWKKLGYEGKDQPDSDTVEEWKEYKDKHSGV